ncbi:hypothetical protein DPMN_132981 [Dreissena polymorpha]|uniref:Uncharacterized protein n=1 Tax=Dreissena polymorpha TaxID=45954 RepID=A0A9D4JDK7_DREPO|nr:hypothetical protein DPMN_132981 [Dreissena polymorpha]
MEPRSKPAAAWQSPGIPYPPAPTGAIQASDAGRATATPRFNSGRRRQYPPAEPR